MLPVTCRHQYEGAIYICYMLFLVLDSACPLSRAIVQTGQTCAIDIYLSIVSAITAMTSVALPDRSIVATPPLRGR